MKRYFVIAGLLFLALTISIAWTGKAPWLGFWCIFRPIMNTNSDST